MAVRCYLRYGLSYRDVEELVAERGYVKVADAWRYVYRAVDQHSQVIDVYAFIQNLRRGRYQLGVETRHEHVRVAAAFDELANAI